VLGRAARDLEPTRGAELRETTLAELGERLFRALFTGTVRNRYHESLGRVLAHGNCGLRLRIELGLKNPAMARLHAIPWEYLRPAEDGHFLGLRRDISIVRYLDLALAGDRPPVPAPLAILVVAGEDLAGSDLALAREHRALARAWSERGAVHVDLLRGATLEMLRDALLARDFHVLHFMGHGGFDPRAGEGSLAFRDEHGRRTWVSGAELAEQLRDRTSLRLVFLNACWTARAVSSGPYAGVATALLGAGVPAVLAMQFAVSDVAALAFSRSFYRRLAQGDTIDAAVTEGRMAIRRLRLAVAEWGTPALFQRLDGGQIIASTVRPRAVARGAAAAGLLVAAALLSWWRFPSQPAERGIASQARPLLAAPPDLHPIKQRSMDASGAGTPRDGGRAQERPGYRTGRPGSSRSSERERLSAPRSYLLTVHGALFVQEVASSVSAEFSQIGQESYLTLHISRTGSPSLHRALLGPADIDLGPGNGRLVVQSIDWDAQTVQLVAEASAH
jgi:hypothetical protein